MLFITDSTEETEAVGRSLAKKIEECGISRAFIAMRGEMGVGKTAFVRGFASELLRELIRRFENKKVFLEVRSKNTAAISLYEKMGFCFAGKRKSFYSNPTDDAFILTLDAKVGTN